MIRPVLSTVGLAKVLGVSPSTVRNWIVAGEIPEAAVRVSPGGRYRILTAQLERAGWLKADQVSP